MTCCSSGKARVYYNIPSKSGLKYKLKGSTKWQTIFANELLTFSCIKFSGTTITWTCPLDLENGFGGQSGSYTHPVPISFLGVQGGFQVSNWIINCQTISNPIESVNIPSTCARNGDPPININFTENEKYKFTITGTDTNTKYVDIEVDE